MLVTISVLSAPGGLLSKLKEFLPIGECAVQPTCCSPDDGIAKEAETDTKVCPFYNHGGSCE